MTHLFMCANSECKTESGRPAFFSDTHCPNCQSLRPDIQRRQTSQTIQTWDAAKFKKDYEVRGKEMYHNGLNEWIPKDASREYIEQRHHAKGMTVHFDSDPRRLRGKRISLG